MPRLKKRFGQHLLVSQGAIKNIVKFANIKPGEVVVEIGPGTGNLTKELLKAPLSRLYLVEIDEEMFNKLSEELKDQRVKVFLADATEFDFFSLGHENIKCIGNLPYNVASLIIENTVKHHPLVSEAIYMVQKEVGIRLEKEKSWLSIFVRTFYEVEYMMSLPPKFFIPPPRVESSVIRLKRKNLTTPIDPQKYKEVLTKLFHARRKMLKQKVPLSILNAAGIKPEKRVDELELKEFLLLYDAFCTCT